MLGARFEPSSTERTPGVFNREAGSFQVEAELLARPLRVIASRIQVFDHLFDPSETLVIVVSEERHGRIIRPARSRGNGQRSISERHADPGARRAWITIRMSVASAGS